MDAVTLATLAAAGAAVLLLIIYLVARGRERGRDPHYATEIFLFYDPARPAPDPTAAAARHGSTVAARGQVEVYAASGGRAEGHGLVAEGMLVSLAPTGTGQLVLTSLADRPPPAHGVWLYGPKPRRGTRGIAPFSCAHWFHPEGAAARP